MSDREIVSPAEVLRVGRAEHQVKGGTFLQRTGLVLAGSVGALASVVTVALVMKWVYYAPPVPTISNDLHREQARFLIENYKLLQQATLEPFSTLFDSIVVKVLLPIFTSILGYIFGTRNTQNARD
jgi:hypothetical protein